MATGKAFGCGRCGGITSESPEFCWYCMGPLCGVCWEVYGHCGHPKANEMNEAGRARVNGDEFEEKYRSLLAPFVPPAPTEEILLPISEPFLRMPIPEVYIELVGYNVKEFNLRVWLGQLAQHAGVDGLNRILLLSLDPESSTYKFSFDGIREQIERGDKVFVMEQWSDTPPLSGCRYLKQAPV